MGFKCGIVGLPNVGKSTLFNALTQTATAQALNYPFCTIDPNVGEVAVPDKRLFELGNVARSNNITPTRMTFVDIAGLVRGASKGEGLGNQFLGNIREMDAIAYVVRCFEDKSIPHVQGMIDPVEDCRTVETELMLADIDSLESRLSTLMKKAKSNDAYSKDLVTVINKALEILSKGQPARSTELSEKEIPLFLNLGLLTAKPVIYVCNVDETSLIGGNKFSDAVELYASKEEADVIVISAAIEAEISQLDKEDRLSFMSDLGVKQPGLDKLITAGYKLLGLLTYFTAGEKETRAWTIPRGSAAPRAARAIHTDFEKGFIRAEVISYIDFVNLGGEQGAKNAGKMRIEGKDYVGEDGDVILFRFNV